MTATAAAGHPATGSDATGADPGHPAPAPATPPRRPRSRRDRVIGGMPVWLPLLAFVLLVLGGVTSSSIGFSGLREDPAAPQGFELGDPQSTRPDEFMTESPIWLGQIAVGFHHPVNPLSVSPDFFAQLPAGPVSSVVFFDGTLLQLGPWLPDAMLFAFKWWLPTLMLAIGLPYWFRRVTGSWRWGYLAAVLCFVAPASLWWSMRPINTLGFMFASCALGILGADEISRRRWARATAYLVAAGILMARFPTYYQPLAIVLGFPVLLSTVGYLLARGERSWRERIVSVVALGASGGLFTGLLVLENLPALKAGLSTVFPGDRKSTGLTISVGRIFGATDLGFMKSIDDVMNNSNASEVSTAFTVLLLVLALLVVAQRWQGDRGRAWALWPMVASALFWLSWCSLSWGAIGYRIPLANLVPYFRAANGVGFLAVLAFCLFMTQWARPARRATPLVAGLLTAFVSAWAGSSLQGDTTPLLSSTMIWFSSVLAGVAVALLVWLPHRRWPLVIAGALAALMTYNAAPVLVGLADLRGTSSSQFFLDRAPASRADGSLWASNSTFVDALMFATGTPALSSRQQIGPDTNAWEKLDPGRAHEQVWNRGGSYITFDWADGSDITFTNPNPDVILIRVSPCTLASRMPQLRYVVSTKPLQDACLTKTDTVRWSGIEQTVYRVAGRVPGGPMTQP